MKQLRGDLETAGIIELLQLLESEAKTGRLEIKRGHERFTVQLSRGHLCWATPWDIADENDSAAQEWTPEFATRETLFTLLRRGSGMFRFVELPEADVQDASMTSAELFARLLAWQQLVEQAPPDETVLHRSSRSGSPGASEPDGGGLLETIYDAVDGERSVAEVVERAGLGAFVGLELLCQLRDAGWLAAQPVEIDEATHGAGHEAKPQPAPDWRTGAAVATILAVLVALAWWVHQPASTTTSSAWQPLRADALVQAQQAAQQRRVHRALSAYRFAQGHWPQRLEQLVEEGYLEDDALTAVGERPYYYAQRDDRALLLAPER